MTIIPEWARDLPPLQIDLSDNHSRRPSWWSKPEVVTVHTPQGGYAGAIATCKADRGDDSVSYHCIVREDGHEATQLVPWKRKAWHAMDDNARSEGISAAGYAATFRPRSEQGRRLARLVAYRLHVNGLPATWTRGRRGVKGFCRHADVQSNRTDPTPNLARWLIFVYMVKRELKRGGFRQSYGVDL